VVCIAVPQFIVRVFARGSGPVCDINDRADDGTVKGESVIRYHAMPIEYLLVIA